MHAISGTTERCIAHLAKAIKGRDFYEKRKQIAIFADVADSTVHDWFSENRMPVGEPLIRLRFYLEFLGYHVEEVQSMPQTLRDAARLYAFGIASLSEIADLVGYGGEEENAKDTLMRVFRGARNVSPERLRQFGSFVELYGDRFEEKRRAVPKVLSLTDTEAHSQRATEHHGAPTVTRSASHALGNQSAVVESFAGLITAMLPLAEYVLSDSFTAAQRSRVRELAGGGKGVSRLSNLFTQLSGEAARTALTNSSKKEAGQ
jgi:hypothetical protein